MPTTIELGSTPITLINVFAVRPERQRELADLLARATEEVMSGLPGFVSANIHLAVDGTRVINYAQWRTEEDFTAMLADPVAQPHMRAAAEVAESYEPHLCSVDSVHAAGG